MRWRLTVNHDSKFEWLAITTLISCPPVSSRESISYIPHSDFCLKLANIRCFHSKLTGCSKHSESEQTTAPSEWIFVEIPEMKLTWDDIPLKNFTSCKKLASSPPEGNWIFRHLTVTGQSATDWRGNWSNRSLSDWLDYHLTIMHKSYHQWRQWVYSGISNSTTPIESVQQPEQLLIPLRSIPFLNGNPQR